jgi:predicted  nucleic acid-binding Zn-ribbon protein
MKTKNPNPTVEDEIAALEQEIKAMKDRARIAGKLFSETAERIVEIEKENKKLRKQLTEARMA